MRAPRLGRLGIACLAFVLSCGGQGGGMGTINVRLVDGPITGYQQINVNIQRVEIGGENGWTTLGEPMQTYDLLSLTGGVSATLVEGKTIPAGHYSQIRLVLGSGNTIVLEDGSVEDLKVPSGMQSGLKLLVNFDVQAGTTRDVVIDFVAPHSIQVVQTGNSNKYILRPTIHVVTDFLATGSISGKLTDASGAPLVGAEVTAQTLDGGAPAVVNHAFTGADGSYLLGLLPAGGTYYVVSQPVVGTQAYEAKASGGFTISDTSPTFVYNASFAAVPATGTVSGSITPALEGDKVDLLQTLAPGGSGSATFVLRTGVPQLTTSGTTTTETYGFLLVPPGSYSVRATRDAVVKVSPVGALAAGGTLAVNFTFP
ncbi:MAG TPA: DUF4382 domain-containing protein [Anaeromyxobacteraceae bacterium]|nr:DUF4382 domain-containing protein [Anaeromyxobacteraceae bacterium]